MSLQQGLRETSDQLWLQRQCLDPSLWSLSLELEQAYLLAGVSVSIVGSRSSDLLFIKTSASLSLLLAARRADRPAGKVPSGQGLLPPEGRKHHPACRTGPYTAFVGPVPADV